MKLIETKFTCAVCGGSFPMYEQYTVDEKLLCPNCAEWQTINCSECGKRILKTNDKGDKKNPLCSDCWNDFLK